jgi:threonine dehydrogenase-like Zn-dependent dehydrogenase
METETTVTSPASLDAARQPVVAAAVIPSHSTMKAAVIASPGNVQITTTPVPRPAENEVLVRLEGCGVCGSNLAPWEGRPWFKYPFPPGDLGHEGWGRVAEIGAKVSRVNIGDRVAILSYHAFAEYDVASQDSVVRLPVQVARDPFPGEALGCAMNVFRRSDVFSGQTVAIIGIGFLGAVLTALCASAGAHVVGVSRRPFALETARRMGAQETMPLDDSAAVIQRVRALTDDKGCHCVIEATGTQAGLDLATELTRERGRLVIAGYHQDNLRRVNMQLWNWRGIDVINAHERDPRVYLSGIQAAAQAISNGIFNPAPLYTHTFPLAQLGAALNALKERPAGFLKSLILYEQPSR